jgi:copper chaperone NosL
MVTRRRFLAAVVAGAIGGVAGPTLWTLTREPEGNGPAAIAYGSDRCDRCGMIISEVRFAAAWRAGREVRHYDDVGCLLDDAGAHLAAGRGQAFVHDFAHGDWIEAAGAAFVRSPAIRSPMGSGIAAFAAPADAAASHPGTTVVTWAGLLAGPSRARS